MMIRSSSLLLASAIPSMINAWMNPQFKNDRMIRITRQMTGADEDDNEIDSYRLRLENLFETQENILDNDWSSLDFEPIRNSLETTSSNNGGWLDNNIQCQGDDCEQCEIPDDLKQQALSVDVLDFLGIQRATPIRTRRIED